MRSKRWLALGLVAVAVACSSGAVVVDAGLDAADDSAAASDAKADKSIADASFDNTVIDAGDATIADAGVDSTLNDAGTDATLSDASDGGLFDAGPCSDAALDGSLTTLATLQFTDFVAIDSANVYWPSGNAIRRCAIGGCGGTPATVMTLPLGQNASGIAVDSTNVYAGVATGPLDASASYIVRCASSGCDGGVKLAGGQVWPIAVAVDGTNVYWTDFYAGTVMACAKNGCNGVPTTIASSQDAPLGIATDGTNVYWANSGQGDAGVPGVFFCPTSGCSGSPTAVTLNPYYDAGAPSLAVAADGVNIYWTFATGAASVIVQSPLDGGASTILANAEDQVAYLTTDGKNVYWTNNTYSGKVRRCTVDGCCLSPTTLATQNYAQGIAVDSTNVYWALFGSSSYDIVQLTPK